MAGALGFIETRGWVALIEAVDAMTKTAQVEYLGWHPVGGGLVTAVVRGDVASVQAAVEVGVQAGERVGEVLVSHVIPRPHEDLVNLLPLKGPSIA